MKSPQETLAWLLEKQPRNICAINALQKKLGLPLTACPPKKKKSHWLNGQIAKENKQLRAMRRYLPGHEPDRLVW